MCDKNGCAKCYHVKCLELPKNPHGRWLCPWHFCDECGKNATIKCVECPNSFCKLHAENQVICAGEGKYMCLDHSSEETPKEEGLPDVSQDLGQFCNLGFGDDLVNEIPGITSLDLKDLPQNPQDMDQVQ